MAKLKLLHDKQGRKNGYAQFYCPGCKENHTVAIDTKIQGANWKLSGTLDKPTLAPSVFVKTGHYCKGQPQPPNCTSCNHKDEDGEPWPWGCAACHSFVRDGQIQFLNDCTHELAGQTIPLEDIK